MPRKTKKRAEAQEETIEELPFVPPEIRELSERYIVRIPVSDPHFEDPWQLRLYISKTLEKDLGDEVQLTSLKIKKPHVISKSVARIRKREPEARAYVTVKF